MFQDLGWKDAPNKKAGLGIEYVRKSIVWLANFHATSYAFIENYEVDVYFHPYFNYQILQHLLTGWIGTNKT